MLDTVSEGLLRAPVVELVLFADEVAFRNRQELPPRSGVADPGACKIGDRGVDDLVPLPAHLRAVLCWATQGPLARRRVSSSRTCGHISQPIPRVFDRLGYGRFGLNSC